MSTSQPPKGSLKRGSPQVREREAKALRLRAEGATYDEIGRQLGVSRPMAARVVHRALDRVVREPANHLIALECTRLDLLTKAHMPKALAGSARAAEIVLRVMERRARLLGLDAPVRSEVHVMSAEEQDALDREIEALLRSYREGGGEP
jgi:predicted DNA-binding protein (UPF0251 family)